MRPRLGPEPLCEICPNIALGCTAAEPERESERTRTRICRGSSEAHGARHWQGVFEYCHKQSEPMQARFGKSSICQCLGLNSPCVSSPTCQSLRHSLNAVAKLSNF